MPSEYRVSPEKLTALVRAIFERNGLSRQDAQTMADSLVAANARGVHSHGVLRVENYVKKLQRGSVNPHPKIQTVSETPFSAVLDGDNGLGCIVSSYAAALCRRKAEAVGIGCVSVRNSNHYGTSAYYCEQMAGDDMIAFSCSNVEPIMAPPGATRVAIGNNPFCMVAPAGRYPHFCSDMASSQVAWGKVMDFRLKGKRLPEKWAIDADGNPTDDPNLAAFLMPMGAHKGYGVAAQLEILCSLLSGGAFGDSIPGMYKELEKPNDLSHYFMCMKISAFRDLDAFKADMDRFMEFLHSIPTQDGGRIIVPGELEERSKAAAEKDGIAVTEALARELLELAGDPADPQAVSAYFSVEERRSDG